MAMMRVIGAAAIAMVFTASAARAQEQGQVGLAMGYPGAVAVIWHVTDAVAIRPEFVFTASDTTSTNQTSSSTSVGVGVSGVFYLAKWEALRSYVSPRLTYTRATTETQLTIATGLPTTIPPINTSTTIHTTSVSGSFGAQYALHKRFSAFGEVGLGYSRLKPSSLVTQFPGLTTITPRLTSWSTRSAAGVIFYF